MSPSVTSSQQPEAKLEREILAFARKAQAASHALAEFDTKTKNAWLLRVAERLEAAREAILEANARDLGEAEAKGVAEPLVNRLAISEDKWRDMIQGLRDVCALPDPASIRCWAPTTPLILAKVYIFWWNISCPLARMGSPVPSLKRNPRFSRSVSCLTCLMASTSFGRCSDSMTSTTEVSKSFRK